VRPFANGYHHPDTLRQAFKVMAVLDCLLESNPHQRYHRLLLRRLPGTDVGFVDNGAGDEMLCLFSDDHGCLIKGFDHNSPLSPHAFATRPDNFRPWPGIYEETPHELLQYLDSPEFNKVETTFCIWRGKRDEHWLQGNVEFPPDRDDGSSFLLGTVHVDAKSYLDWACDYYSMDVPREPVFEIYSSSKVSRSAALALNPSAPLTVLEQELSALGSSLA
jgi:hypothetical protein